MESSQTLQQKLIGQTVRHIAFGSGVIEELQGNVLKVNFPQGDKKFIYPEAFVNFLKLEDEESMKEIDRRMENRRKQAREKQAEALKKEATRRKFRSVKVLPESHAVFNLSEEEISSFRKTGSVFCGRYQSGFSEGRARIAGRIKPNSLCFVTSLEKGAAESERMLRGFFMAREDYYGDERSDGLVMAHGKYMEMLPEEQQFRLWEAVGEKARPARFGGSAFRYIKAEDAMKVLTKLSEVMGEDKQDKLKELTDYFKRLNNI